MNGKEITIAALGDSMTDTFGENMPRLVEALTNRWPEREFDARNYGVGRTRVGYGLWRLTNEYEHWGKKHPPLVSIDPDVVILESFAYNNATDGVNEEGLKHFRETHEKIVETLRQKTKAKIVFVATIAPDRERCLESVPAFFNTPVSIRAKMADDRFAYLEESLKIAASLSLPVANVFQKTIENARNGIPLSTYITPDDWIHPSDEGHKLIASTIADTLETSGILDEIPCS